MIRKRVPLSQLTVFKTFNLKSKPEFLTIESKFGNFSMLEELPNLGFAIVGTRYPQRRSVELLEETLHDLRNSDLIIISGFARGIDTKAHEHALKNGLRTIALLGCGIDVPYPRENQRLRQEILEAGGLIISQFEDQLIPYAGNFYHRNQLIAGFSKATWVVEAAEVSGSLNTANLASEMNRDLYATSCFPKDHYYQGNVKLLSQRNPDRYPIAHAFFNTDSLGTSWPGLPKTKETQTELSFPFTPKTEIQKWILMLQTNAGECRIQALMNYASKQGQTLGEFYKKFESEVSKGLVRHDENGRVEIIHS